MLGQSLVRTLGELNTSKLFGISHSRKLNNPAISEFQVDIGGESSVRKILNDVQPDIIIHTAALTNLQLCENDKSQAQRVHIHLTRALAEAHAKFIYISTDSVFEGKESSYREDDPTYPLNYYAQSKLQGEWAALCANPEALILRTNIFGFKTPVGNSLVEWALTSFQAGKIISGYNDVFFNPLYVGQLSQLIREAIDRNVKGILHVGTIENISKFEFLKILAKAFDYPEALVAETVAPPDTTLRRPKNTTLNIDRMKTSLKQTPSIHAGMTMLKSDYLQYL